MTFLHIEICLARIYSDLENSPNSVYTLFRQCEWHYILYLYIIFYNFNKNNPPTITAPSAKLVCNPPPNKELDAVEADAVNAVND